MKTRDRQLRVLAQCDAANARLAGYAPHLLSAMRELLEWEGHMGGWDAPCWQRARKLLREIEKPAR